MRKNATVIAAMLAVILASGPTAHCLAAQIIKLGSLAPAGSPWDKGLRTIAAEWGRISNGAITVKIYAGGIVGDEMDMIRKMRIDQLNAAGLTGVGLCRIYPDILTIQAPMLVRTNEQLARALDAMKPGFEKGLEEKGFTIIVWNSVGWVHFFSRAPVVRPADLQKQKLFVWAGDEDAVQVWKDMGFHPIPLNVTDLMSSLQSGMVDAFSTTPLSAASNQWFGLATHMCDLKWAPLIAGIVVSKKTWDRIPADLRPKCLESAQKAGAAMEAEVADADRSAIDIMKQNGLRVHNVPADAEAEWQAAVTKGTPRLFGSSINKSTYEAIQAIIK